MFDLVFCLSSGNGHYIKANKSEAGILVLKFSGSLPDPAYFLTRDKLFRKTEGITRSGFDLHKNEEFLFPDDEINFQPTSSPVPGHNFKAFLQ